MLKLGTEVKDKATGLKGSLTHMQLEMGGQMFYRFQPKGVNKEDGQPVPGMWLPAERVIGGVEVDMSDMHELVLGTEVEDTASGFCGIATAVVLHISGCVHVNVQPRGTLSKGSPIAPCDFDIRRLKGRHVPKMTEAKREKDQVRRPSPGRADAFGRFVN